MAVHGGRLWPLLAAAALALAGCGGSSEAAAQADPAPTTTAATATPTGESWPPPLPPGVPTTGEHAWRATWTPDPDADRQYLQSLIDGGYDPAQVGAQGQDLIDAGYAVCSFYYQGAKGGAPVDAMATAGKYDVLQAMSIELAARHYFCLNIDPYGQSY